MTQLPPMRKLQPLPTATVRRVGTTGAAWGRIVATLTNPELVTITVFCAIGFLIAINLILRFPDFGATLQRFQQF